MGRRYLYLWQAFSLLYYQTYNVYRSGQKFSNAVHFFMLFGKIYFVKEEMIKMKKNVRCLIGIFMMVAMLCDLGGCTSQLEVFFDDYGMIEFAVNGLSIYYTTVDNFQQENNWKVYTCDDGTMIIFYPGEPAHLEDCDGDYAGIYDEGSDKGN